MSHEALATSGKINTIICLVSTVTAWFTYDNIQHTLAIIASVVAICSGILASRYYIKAANKFDKP